jgi:hypothetical protein
MANPNLADVIGRAWRDAHTAPEVEHAIRLRDGRTFMVWLRFAARQLEQYAAYRYPRARTGHRYRKGTFNYDGLVTDGRYGYQLWTQAPGWQPRFTYTPASWERYTGPLWPSEGGMPEHTRPSRMFESAFLKGLR